MYDVTNTVGSTDRKLNTMPGGRPTSRSQAVHGEPTTTTLQQRNRRTRQRQQ